MNYIEDGENSCRFVGAHNSEFLYYTVSVCRFSLKKVVVFAIKNKLCFANHCRY
jgi:hypothetical protein